MLKWEVHLSKRVPTIEGGGGEFSPLENVSITNLSASIVIEKPSAHNNFSIGPLGYVFYQPPPRDLVATMFGTSAPLWDSTLGQYISKFVSMSTIPFFPWI